MKKSRKPTPKTPRTNAFSKLGAHVKRLAKWLATQLLDWLARLVFDTLADAYLKTYVTSLLIVLCGALTQTLEPPSGLSIAGSSHPVISIIEIADVAISGLRHFTVMVRDTEPPSSVR